MLAVLGLHCFEGSSQAEVSGGYSSLRCLDFLLQWLLLLWSMGYRARRLHSPGSSGVAVPPPECRLGSCGAQAQPLCSMWDRPGPGIEPASPALADGLSTTEPPGKSLPVLL